MWEVTERVKMMKNQWLQVVSYQKQLPSTSESLENSPNIGTVCVSVILVIVIKAQSVTFIH